MLLYICVKFHLFTLESQSDHNFVTDRQTDRRPGQKNKMSPNPTWGDIIMLSLFYEDSTFSITTNLTYGPR